MKDGWKWGARPLALALAAALASTACNKTPASGTLDELTVEVETRLSNADAVKLDILWVIDHSSSMCQEQNSLAQTIDSFTDVFAAFNVDLRMAVVDMDGLVDEAGAFQNAKFPGPYPPNCFEGEVLPCLSDSDCSGPLGSEAWTCNRPLQGLATYMTNANCSINTECRYRCLTDEECRDYFGDPTLICVRPGNDPNQARCQQPPVNASCPDELPLYVSTAGGNLDVFPCLAVRGAVQYQTAQLEQGINAAMWALASNPEPGAPDRSQQAQDFVREDAYQLIIFVTDEDDCSLALQGGELANLPKEQWNSCGCVPDANSGGPLVPVPEAVARLRSINRDPGRVLVAAITGDVIVGEQTGLACLNCPDDGEVDSCIESRRQSFFSSKCGPGPVAQNTYICESISGKSDFGSRYIELVRQFGNNGIFANICNDEGFGPALTQIADAVRDRIIRYCLPRPPINDDAIRVTLRDTATEAVTELVRDEDYRIEDGAACPGAAEAAVPPRAVSFIRPLQQGQEVIVVYQASIFGQ